MTAILESIANQAFKRDPWLVILIVLLSVGLISYSYHVFSEKKDVDARFLSIDHRFDTLDDKIDLAGLEQRRHSIGTEIFRLERLSVSGKLRQFGIARLDNIKIELRGVETRIQSLIR